MTIVDKPTFSSPTKEALISSLGNDGSRCELSDLFLDVMIDSGKLDLCNFSVALMLILTSYHCSF